MLRGTGRSPTHYKFLLPSYLPQRNTPSRQVICTTRQNNFQNPPSSHVNSSLGMYLFLSSVLKRTKKKKEHTLHEILFKPNKSVQQVPQLPISKSMPPYSVFPFLSKNNLSYFARPFGSLSPQNVCFIFFCNDWEKFFKFILFILLENAFVNLNIFTYAPPPGKTLPQVFITSGGYQL